MQWFGHDHQAPIYILGIQVPRPIGSKCVWCEEQIGLWDDGFIDSEGSIFHRACFLRQLQGSIQHQKGECGCFNPIAQPELNLDLTIRQEAEAALKYYESKHPRSIQ